MGLEGGGGEAVELTSNGPSESEDVAALLAKLGPFTMLPVVRKWSC